MRHTAISEEAQPLRRFGRYEILGRLGAGGMAEVFLARLPLTRAFDATHGYQFVALKKMLPHLATDSAFVARFKREAMIATRLDHPSIARVFKAGRLGARWFMVMELIRGETLARVLERERQRDGTVPVRVLQRCGAEIARALHFVHELQEDGRPLHIVHRDVSPQNVVLAYDGHVKLIDFGVARWADSTTRTGSLAGKVRYFSPEQIRGESVDRRSDIYSLGVMLYEALLGAPAFSGPNEMAIMEAILQGNPRKMADPPDAILAPIRRAMSPDPRDRFSSAQEFASALVAHGPARRGLATGAPDPTIAAYLRRLIPEGPQRWATILEHAAAGIPFDDEVGCEKNVSSAPPETESLSRLSDRPVTGHTIDSPAFQAASTVALPPLFRTLSPGKRRAIASVAAVALLGVGLIVHAMRTTVTATADHVRAPAQRQPEPIDLAPPAPPPEGVVAAPPAEKAPAEEAPASLEPVPAATASGLTGSRQRGPTNQTLNGGRHRKRHARASSQNGPHRTLRLAHIDSPGHAPPESITDQLEPSPYRRESP